MSAAADARAECLLRGGRVLNVFTGELETTNVLVGGGLVLGVGPGYREAPHVYEVDGTVVLPGFIDGHFHIESSLLTPARLAEVVVPHGTTTIVADPHEIANVLGLEGVRWMLEASAGLPLDCFFMAPSCVPASPLETSGAELGPCDVATMLGWDRVLGLAEVMDFGGVMAGRPELMEKIHAAHRRDRPVDGHAPLLSGRDLDRYLSAGIESDHECVGLEEAREKLKRGMRIMIREGSHARNLRDLAPLVSEVSARRCLLVSDDRDARDLARRGHVDHLLRLAVANGLSALWAVQMATVNPAEYFGLRRLGAVAPGYRADLVVVDNLTDFQCALAFKDGHLVARRGELVTELGPAPSLRAAMNVGVLSPSAFRIPARPGRIRVIGLLPDQLETRALLVDAPVRGDEVVADPGRDLAKLVVIERHHGTGRIGRGLVNGLGLKRGALASTVAHDSHNVIAAGVDDDDLRAAVARVTEQAGGLAVAAGGTVAAALPLPVAGLMSDQPWRETVRALECLEQHARELGVWIANPFGALSFLALSVVPSLRVTDQGLVDVDRGALVPLFVDAEA